MKIVISDPLGFEDEHMSMVFEAAGDDTVVVPSEDDLVAELADAAAWMSSKWAMPFGSLHAFP